MTREENLTCTHPDLRLGSYTVSAAGPSPRFAEFVAAMVDHARDLLCREIAADPASQNSPDVKMRFVLVPLLATDPVPPPQEAGRVTFSAEHELRSPWLQLLLSRSPRLSLRATFLWSERQMLLDQALLNGGRARDSRHLAPLAPDSFAAMEAAYRRSSASGAAVPDPAPDDIPADIVWLLRHLPPKTPASAPTTAAERQAVIDQASSKQIIFTRGLFDRAFSTKNPLDEFRTVYDTLQH